MDEGQRMKLRSGKFGFDSWIWIRVEQKNVELIESDVRINERRMQYTEVRGQQWANMHQSEVFRLYKCFSFHQKHIKM